MKSDIFESRLHDRVQISELLSRYCSIVDDKNITEETVATVFAADGQYVKPNGAATIGPRAIAEEEGKIFSRFRATHHVSSDHIIEFDGNIAYLRANMTAMHIWGQGEIDPFTLESHFLAGGVFKAIAIITDNGWRFSELSTRIVWRTGAGMTSIVKLGKKD